MKCDKCGYDLGVDGAHVCTPNALKANRRLVRIVHYYNDGSYEEIPVVQTQFIPGPWTPPIMPPPVNPQPLDDAIGQWYGQCPACGINLSGALSRSCPRSDCPCFSKVTC